MTTLAVYTTGDTRQLQVVGRRAPPNMPADQSELYRRRAVQVAGANGVIQGFATRQAFFAWCAQAENNGRFDDVRFVGHGSTNVFYFAVGVRNGLLEPVQDGEMNLVTYVNEISEALNRIMMAQGSGWGAAGSNRTRGLTVDFEACNVARENLLPFARSIAHATGAPTTAYGYRAFVVTRWSARHQAPEILCARHQARDAPQVACDGFREQQTSTGM